MKIAIGISGLFREKLYHDPIESIEQIKNKFKADLYCHTWQGKENLIPDRYKREGFFFTSKEPELDYHPILDPEPTTNPKHLIYIKKQINRSKTSHHNKQIIGYCNLFDQIPKNYDLYIRTRWDVRINPNFDFEFFFKNVKKGAVGFMTRETGPNFYSYKKNVGKIVKKEKSKTKINDWHDMLSDYLIMHRENQLNTKLVYELHKKKQLLGAEWGWWQVFSKPYGGVDHTSVYGGVVLVREKRKFHIDKNFKIRRIFS